MNKSNLFCFCSIHNTLYFLLYFLYPLPHFTLSLHLLIPFSLYSSQLLILLSLSTLLLLIFFSSFSLYFFLTFSFHVFCSFYFPIFQSILSLKFLICSLSHSISSFQFPLYFLTPLFLSLYHTTFLFYFHSLFSISIFPIHYLYIHFSHSNHSIFSLCFLSTCSLSIFLNLVKFTKYVKGKLNYTCQTHLFSFLILLLFYLYKQCLTTMFIFEGFLSRTT